MNPRRARTPTRGRTLNRILKNLSRQEQFASEVSDRLAALERTSRRPKWKRVLGPAVVVVTIALAVVGIVVSVVNLHDSRDNFDRVVDLTSSFQRDTDSSMKAMARMTSAFEGSTDSSLDAVKKMTARFRTETQGMLRRIETVTMAIPDTVITRIEQFPDLAGLKATLLGGVDGRPDFDAMNSPAAYNRRGLAKAKSGDFVGALRDLNTALALFTAPEQKALVHNNLAWVKRMTRDHQGALVDAEKAVNLDSTKSQYYNQMGVAFLQLGHHTRAIIALTTSLSKSITRLDSALALGNRSIAFKRMGSLAQAETDVQKAMVLDSTDAALRFNLALVRHSKGDYKGAEQAASAAIGLDSVYWQAYALRAQIKSQQGDNTGALIDFDAALASDSSKAELYNLRGVVHIRLGELNLAGSDFQRAVEVDSTHAEAHANLALVAARLGKLSVAVRHYESSLRHGENLPAGVAPDIRRRLDKLRNLDRR